MLDITNLRKEYKGLCVLQNFNLHVEKDEILAIVGPSGCGKSTLLNLIAGITKGYEGEISNRANKTGYVFQEDRILPWLTVYENIKIVRKQEDERRIQELIRKMHLEGFEDYYPGQLSGGMRQRCGIARAFYFGSELLLMDEPFKSLDCKLRLEMLQHLNDIWQDEKKTVIFVTHDIEEALMIADRIVILKNRPSNLMKEVKLERVDGLRDITSKQMMQLKNELVQLIA